MFWYSKQVEFVYVLCVSYLKGSVIQQFTLTNGRQVTIKKWIFL